MHAFQLLEEMTPSATGEALDHAISRMESMGTGALILFLADPGSPVPIGPFTHELATLYLQRGMCYEDESDARAAIRAAIELDPAVTPRSLQARHDFVAAGQAGRDLLFCHRPLELSCSVPGFYSPAGYARMVEEERMRTY